MGNTYERAGRTRARHCGLGGLAYLPSSHTLPPPPAVGLAILHSAPPRLARAAARLCALHSRTRITGRHDTLQRYAFAYLTYQAYLPTP